MRQDNYNRVSMSMTMYVYIGVIQGLYRDNGKERGNYYSIGFRFQKA